MRKVVGVIIYIGIVIAWLFILVVLSQLPNVVTNVAKALNGGPLAPSEARVIALILGGYSLALYAGGIVGLVFAIRAIARARRQKPAPSEKSTPQA
jgi:hypothetical protein